MPRIMSMGHFKDIFLFEIDIYEKSKMAATMGNWVHRVHINYKENCENQNLLDKNTR